MRLLANAVGLSESARVELAAELLASLNRPVDTDAQQAWEAEIGRRIAAIESGGLPLESWDDLRQRVAEDVLGR